MSSETIESQPIKSSKEMRKTKLKSIRESGAATKLQAAWRGKSARISVERIKITDDDKIDKDKDEEDLEPPVDQEEESLENLAAVEEESVIQVVHNDVDASETLSENVATNQYQESLHNDSVNINSWPASLTIDHTSEPHWKDLNTSSHEDVENWIRREKCIYIRLVTWNLCAKKPPNVDDVTKMLLPRDK